MKKLAFFLLLPLIVFAQEKIDLNTTTSKELEGLSGIGPSYAQRIVDNRPFSSVDDLIKVNGIGEKTLQKIKEQGLAYVSNDSSNDSMSEVEPHSSPDVIRDPSFTTQDDYSGIFFNEVMPSPEGADAENEWIELYNSNDLEIDLSGWIIKDITGGVKEYIINDKIPALGYLTLKRPETDITLNNNGDGLILLNPNGEIIDSVNFEKAVQGQSYIRTSSEWVWTTTPTPNKENILKIASLAQTPKTTSVSAKKEPQSSAEAGPRQNYEAKLVDNLERSSKISVVFVGFLIALCSSVAFLIIKNNLKNFWY